MRYRVPAAVPYRFEETVRRSRFIVTLAHAPTALQAKSFVAGIREEFPDATHNCWAYAAGAPGDTAAVGYSDDGEPHGTAGRPMLQALLYGGLGEAVCVITRYFGGIKLGAGGLVRAYSSLAARALAQAPSCEKIEPLHCEIVLDYARIGAFKRLVPLYEGRIVREGFGADAEFEVIVPAEKGDAFMRDLREAMQGEVLVGIKGS